MVQARLRLSRVGSLLAPAVTVSITREQIDAVADIRKRATVIEDPWLCTRSDWGEVGCVYLVARYQRGWNTSTFDFCITRTGTVRRTTR